MAKQDSELTVKVKAVDKAQKALDKAFAKQAKADAEVEKRMDERNAALKEVQSYLAEQTEHK